MKRIALALITFGLIVGNAAAVVDNKTRNNSDVGITSGSSSATTGVNPNGTQYTAKVEMRGRTSNASNIVENVSYADKNKVTFSGVINASNPCHTLEHDLNETGDDSYILNIKTVDSESAGACATVVTGIKYDAEFEADAGFNLEVRHNNRTIETMEDRVVEPKPEPGLLEKILNFLGL
jgi:hypothetical protein